MDDPPKPPSVDDKIGYVLVRHLELSGLTSKFGLNYSTITCTPEQSSCLYG